MAVLNGLASWAIPFFLGFIPLYGWLKGVKVYDAFVEGAEEGLEVGVKILPLLVGVLVALAVFRAAGAMGLLAQLLSPITGLFGFPTEVVPLMLVRPLSGSGALGVTADLLQTQGADSFVGRLASIMQGSTDTTFYVLTVYFGSVGVKRLRYAPLVGLAADFIGFVTALAVALYFFGGV